MRIVSCQLVASAPVPARFPRDGFPQIAFMGRSNVGKSSLINRLLGRAGLARTSKTPGRTRAINFFCVNGNSYFVDLPGYGFARVPRPMREEWRGLIEAYLDGPLGPDLAVVLVDARHDPSPLDRELVDWLRSRSIPARAVLTKIDKIPRGRRDTAARRAAEALDLNGAATPLGVSAVTGDGLAALWRILDDAVAAGRRRSTHPAPPHQRDGAFEARTTRSTTTNPPQHTTRGRTPQ